MTKKLTEAGKGEEYEIVDFGDDTTKLLMMRWGLAVGQVIKCLARLGPVIIAKNRQKLAIGRNLANKIIVRAVQA